MKWCCAALLILWYFNLFAQKLPHSYVNPFIGTDNNGNVLPGPCLPFSFMRLGPDVPAPHPTSGYSSGKPIKGFSHTHVSGTGGNGQYGNLSFMPVTGELRLTHYESPGQNEFASAGYYKVNLSRYNIFVELTQSEKTGLHRYTFPSSKKSHILFDISSMIKKNEANGFMHNIRTEAEVIGNTIQGFGEYVGGWGNNKPNKIFFHIVINKPIHQVGTWHQDSIFNGYGKQKLSGNDGGIVLTFSTKKNEKILVKVGISPLSEQAAKENMEKEIPGWDFNAVRLAAEHKWDEYLQRIKIWGGSETEREIFYTALYHTLVMPSDITGENPDWTSDEPAFWDFYTLWDTFRTTNPLLSLMAPEIENRLIRCLLDIYKHRGWLPDGWIVGEYAGKQGGTNADVVIADAILKNLGGFNYDEAYNAIKKNAEEISQRPWLYGRHKEYLQNGFCTSLINCGTSYTLEYAYNDYCVSQVANKLGYIEDAQKYRQRSQKVFNLFNTATDFFWSKDTAGKWVDGFKPDYKRVHQQSGYFYEGTPYQYSFYVPHDMNGLIKRIGGKDAFFNYLERFFNGGFFNNENQPDIHVPYLYNYIGRHDKTTERIQQILETSFNNSRNGLPGNDDAGCMSAWYVFSAMGFYPVPGQNIYLIGVPLFNKVELKIGNNKLFRIIANKNSKENKYVQSVKLNGNVLNNTWFSYEDIKNGGALEFVMGNKFNGWGLNSKNLPSVSD